MKLTRDGEDCEDCEDYENAENAENSEDSEGREDSVAGSSRMLFVPLRRGHSCLLSSPEG